MPGRGPAPKPEGQRARRNKSTVPLHVVAIDPSKQPKLPPLHIAGEELDWPKATKQWWAMWGKSPLAEQFTDIDWSELALTALFHARLVMGHANAGTEYRLRVSKFGATPEDRARLRITFATADTTEAKASRNPKQPKSSRDRIGVLKASGE